MFARIARRIFAGIMYRLDRALGKERLRNERDAARYESKEHLRERDEYHRQLDLAIGERNEYLRQRDALTEQIERDRKRNSSHDLVSALAEALARMTEHRDDLRRERDDIKRELASLTSRVIEPVGPSDRPGRVCLGALSSKFLRLLAHLIHVAAQQACRGGNRVSIGKRMRQVCDIQFEPGLV
jgi:hypothetical protein